MEKQYPADEFETEIGVDGRIALPDRLLSSFMPGQQVIVRITRGTIGRSLSSRGITEDEIERIAAMQLEPRENVVRFLNAQGALSRSHAGRRQSRSDIRNTR